MLSADAARTLGTELLMSVSRRRSLFRTCALLLGSSLVLAWGLPRPANGSEFVLVNESGVMLDQLYISPCGAWHWGPNQLAGTAVMSTRAFAISNLAPGCYDIMVILPVGHECIMAGASLARGRGLSWTINKSTLTHAIFDDCSQTSNIVMGGRRPYLPPER
jgi:hypothetical protein